MNLTQLGYHNILPVAAQQELKAAALNQAFKRGSKEQIALINLTIASVKFKNPTFFKREDLRGVV